MSIINQWRDPGRDVSQIHEWRFHQGASNKSSNGAFTESHHNIMQSTGSHNWSSPTRTKCYFSLIDHFGLNSLFLSITPDDLYSFCVRLYVNANDFVSSINEINFFISQKLFSSHSAYHTASVTRSRLSRRRLCSWFQPLPEDLAYLSGRLLIRVSEHHQNCHFRPAAVGR